MYQIVRPPGAEIQSGAFCSDQLLFNMHHFYAMGSARRRREGWLLVLAYRNRSSPNRDLVEEFLEHYVLTDEGLSAMDHAKPIGVPALISLYDRMAQDNPLVRQLKVSVDQGRIMPNIPQMGRFFTAVGTALQIATDGHASAEAALQEAEANMRHE